MPHLLKQCPTSSSRRVLTLEFIRRYFRDYGASPSYREIAAHLAIPVQRVGHILDELEHRGEIMRTHGASRGIRLTTRIDELSTSELMLELEKRGVIWLNPPKV